MHFVELAQEVRPGQARSGSLEQRDICAASGCSGPGLDVASLEHDRLYRLDYQSLGRLSNQETHTAQKDKSLCALNSVENKRFVGPDTGEEREDFHV